MRRTADRAQAARTGDRRAVDELLTAHLPLIYNIVGRAMDGHPDVDDVVQETMERAVIGIAELRDPGSFRSWLVAIAMRRIRDRARTARRTVPTSAVEYEQADPAADFAGLTVLRLGLEGQRREVAEATRWLDADDREILALWWQEVTGELTRPELASALGLTRQHTAVRVQRLKERLDAARALVRALEAEPRCPDLARVTDGWDGRPGSVWRKRMARHLRSCPYCGGVAPEPVVPAERLLAGLALLPVPAGFALAALVKGSAVPSVSLAGSAMKLFAKPLVAVTTGVTLVAGGAFVVYDDDHLDTPRRPRAVTSTAAPTPRIPTVGAAPAPPSTTPSPTPSPTPPPGYGSVVDTAEPAPDSRRPGALPRRPAPGLTSSSGPKAVMEHRGDTVTLTGRGYVLVRWQFVPQERPGAVAMPTWTGLDGKLFHVASGGGRRMDDQQPSAADRPHTWMGSPSTSFAVLPAGAQQMWQNEYYYVDGSVTLHQNERGADYNLTVMPVARESIVEDLLQPPDPATDFVRYGYVRDTGTDTTPVPQYVTRADPPDPADVPQRSRV